MSKLILIITLVVFCSCTTDSNTSTSDLVEQICGKLPSDGGYAVTYSSSSIGRLATLTDEDFQRLIHERTLMKTWAYCVTDLLKAVQ